MHSQGQILLVDAREIGEASTFLAARGLVVLRRQVVLVKPISRPVGCVSWRLSLHGDQGRRGKTEPFSQKQLIGRLESV